jgi:hypothetical protein
VSRASKVLAVGALAMIAFALAFAYPAYDEVRVFWYYPLERRWAFEVKPRGLAMDWYGRVLLASAAAAVAAAVGAALARRVRLREGLVRLLAAWALTLTVAVMAFYAWQLAFRNPVPEPFPPGHEKR